MAILKVTPKTPAELLVGRYIVSSGPFIYGTAVRPRQVVAAKAKTLEVVGVPRYWNENEKVWMIGESEGAMNGVVETGEHVQLRSVLYCCDTLEELQQLFSTSIENERAFNTLVKLTYAKLEQLVTEGPVPPLLQPEQEQADTQAGPGYR